MPQLGTYVTLISQQGVADAAFVREALECSAIRLATERADEAALAALQANLAAQERAVAEEDAEAFDRLDDALHQALCDLSGHDVAWTLSRRANGHLDRVRRLSLPDPAYMGEMVDEHRAGHRRGRRPRRRPGRAAAAPPPADGPLEPPAHRGRAPRVLRGVLNLSTTLANKHMLDLVRSVDQPFTVGTLVRAAERDGASVAAALAWLREAEGDAVTDTGARRASANALRGARLYRYAADAHNQRAWVGASFEERQRVMATSERQQQAQQNGQPDQSQAARAAATSTPPRRASGSRRSRPSCAHDGPERARELLEALFADARRRSAASRPATSARRTSTRSRSSTRQQIPGDPGVEHRLRSLIRWNAIATVLQANKESSELGGHIASYQSAATLYEVGFNHFWRAPTDEHGGDLVYIQGHSSPGIYARAFLEGRLTEEQLQRFRTGGRRRRAVARTRTRG